MRPPFACRNRHAALADAFAHERQAPKHPGLPGRKPDTNLEVERRPTAGMAARPARRADQNRCLRRCSFLCLGVPHGRVPFFFVFPESLTAGQRLTGMASQPGDARSAFVARRDHQDQARRGGFPWNALRFGPMSPRAVADFHRDDPRQRTQQSDCKISQRCLQGPAAGPLYSPQPWTVSDH